MIWLIGLIGTALALSVSTPCSRLPHSGHLDPAHLDAACRHRGVWLNERDESAAFPSAPRTGTPEGVTSFAVAERQSAYLRFVETCSPSMCIDNRPGQRPRRRVDGEKAIRKEIRMLSNEERQELLEAMHALRNSKVDGTSKWDLYTEIHFPQSAVGECQVEAVQI